MGGDAITEMARQLVRRHPTHPARSLARRLVEEANGAITLEQARYRIRAQLGQSGKRGKPAAKRAARKPGQGVEMPPSKAEKWEPYVLETTGIVGILSDIHVPFHSEVALQSAVGHFKTVGIDALILNGDTCDFYTISAVDQRPEKERLSRRDHRCDAAASVAAARVSRRSDCLQGGNHEERWKHWLWQHAPEISDDPRMGLDQWLDFAEHGIELVEDQRPIMCGELPVLHGHEKGKGISSPVNQARGAFLRLLHTVLEGHGHRTSGHAESDMWHRETFCWSHRVPV
jgi:predicted phosphodiesterase